MSVTAQQLADSGDDAERVLQLESSDSRKAALLGSAVAVLDERLSQQLSQQHEGLLQHAHSVHSLGLQLDSLCLQLQQASQTASVVSERLAEPTQQCLQLQRQMRQLNDAHGQVRRLARFLRAAAVYDTEEGSQEESLQVRVSQQAQLRRLALLARVLPPDTAALCRVPLLRRVVQRHCLHYDTLVDTLDQALREGLRRRRVDDVATAMRHLCELGALETALARRRSDVLHALRKRLLALRMDTVPAGSRGDTPNFLTATSAAAQRLVEAGGTLARRCALLVLGSPCFPLDDRMQAALNVLQAEVCAASSQYAEHGPAVAALLQREDVQELLREKRQAVESELEDLLRESERPDRVDTARVLALRVLRAVCDVASAALIDSDDPERK